MAQDPNKLLLNKPAPLDFSAWTMDREKISLTEILQSYLDQGKAIILNFGSFTCPIWRAKQGEVAALAKQYASKTVHITIYVREAHPSDEWVLQMNEDAGISYLQPKTIDQRLKIAGRAVSELVGPNRIIYVDGIKDPVSKAYTASPIRICLIDIDGKLVFRSKGTAAGGYKPDEFEAFLKKKYK